MGGATQHVDVRLPLTDAEPWTTAVLASVLRRDVDGLARLRLNTEEPDYLVAFSKLSGVDDLPTTL